MNRQRAGVCGAVLILAFVLMLVPVCSGGLEAQADMGPKPSVFLIVENAPEEYYVALLTDDSVIPERNRIHVEDSTVVDFLCGFEQDGWKVFTSPVGQNAFHSNTTGRYMFTYMVPDPFRVLIVDAEKNVHVSPVLDQQAFNARCTYDVAAGTLTEQLSLEDAQGREQNAHPVVIRMRYVVFCYLMTLVIELAVYGFFRIPFTKRNILCFLAINTVTNLSYAYYTVNSVSSAKLFLRCFVFEIGIAFVEAIFYVVMLRDSKGRRNVEKSFNYGIAANFASATAGIVGMMIYTEIKRILLL